MVDKLQNRSHKYYLTEIQKLHAEDFEQSMLISPHDCYIVMQHHSVNITPPVMSHTEVLLI